MVQEADRAASGGLLSTRQLLHGLVHRHQCGGRYGLYAAAFVDAAHATAITVVTHPVRGGAGAAGGSGIRLVHTGASRSSVIPSDLALSLLSIFAFLEGHAAISRIVLTFASDVRLQIGRRTYTRSELVRVRTLAEFEDR